MLTYHIKSKMLRKTRVSYESFLTPSKRFKITNFLKSYQGEDDVKLNENMKESISSSKQPKKNFKSKI